jgi:DNA-binding LytR/AlgR family response regulator
MKIKIELDEQCGETTVIIKTPKITDEILKLSKSLAENPFDLLVGFRNENAIMLDTDRIFRFYSANQKIYAITDDGEYIVKMRLYELEERLSKSKFVRVSNSEIINLGKVKDFDLSFSGSICVRFIDNTTTFVSRRFVAKIKKFLGI